MARVWYYAQGGQKIGPLPSGRLRELATSGELRPDDLVWTEGMSDWREARTVKGLIPGLPSARPDMMPGASNRPAAGAEIGEETPSEITASSSKQPWCCHTAVLAVTTVVFFPVTLVLVWWKSSYSSWAKWAWTAACGLMFLLILGSGGPEDESSPPVSGRVVEVEVAGETRPMQPSDESFKWGFVDPTGKSVIPCRFDDAHDFNQGLAAVKKGEKWGWIDRDGRTIIPFEFDGAGWFHNGRASVKQDEKWGFVDPTGRLVIPCQYDEYGHFEDGHARVTQNGKSFFIDLAGDPSTPKNAKPRVLVVGRGAGARFGFEDGAGKIIVNPQFDAVSDFSESNVAVVSAGDSSGIIDEHGEWVVPLQSGYWIGAFPKLGKAGAGFRPTPSEGLFAYRDNRGMQEGYIRTNGEIAIPARFTNATAFSEGLATVTPAMNLLELERNPESVIRNPIYGKTGYINTTGNFVIPPQFSGGSRFSEGLAAVKVGIEGGKWGFIDKAGKFVVNPQFDDQPSDFKEGLARVRQGGLYGFIDKRGAVVVDPRFTEASDFADGLARVRCP